MLAARPLTANVRAFALRTFERVPLSYLPTVAKGILPMTTVRMATTPLFLMTAMLLSAAGHARAEDHSDKLMEACSRGDQRACQEIEQTVEQNRVQLEELNQRADAFQSQSKDLAVQVDKIPDLKKAYPLAVKDYFASDAIGPSHRRRGWNEQLLATCSQRFHEFWINQRGEWPTDPSGQPDWATIYLQILDHYFRYCSK